METKQKKPPEAPVRPAGRPVTINKDAMKEALLELTANNRPAPSLRRLRRHLGSGSLTTISRLRDEVANESLEAGDAPTALSADPIDSKCDKHYRIMKSAIRQEFAKAAEEETADIEKHCAQLVAAAEQRRDNILQTRDLLIQRADKAESTLKMRDKELRALRDENAELISDREAARCELVEAQGKLSALHQQCSTSADQVIALQQEIVAAEESHQNTIDTLTNDNSSAQKHLLALKSEISELQGDKKELQHSADRRTDALKNIQERLNDRTESINDLKKLKDQLLQKLDSEALVRQKLESERQQLQSSIEANRLESTRCSVELQSEQELHTATKLRLKEISETKDKEISRLQAMYADLLASESKDKH